MLYVSRRTVKDKEKAFGVVDTDDGVETVLTRHDFQMMLRQYPDLDITGIVDRENAERATLQYVFTRWVEPYQLPETVTPKQLKLSTMRAIDIKCFGDMITGIVRRSEAYTKECSVRLSEYGCRLGAFLFMGNYVCGKSMTIIIDDGIKSLSQFTFDNNTGDKLHFGKSGFNIILDLQELHNDNLAGLIYRQMIYNYLDASEVIIDSPYRKSHYFMR